MNENTVVRFIASTLKAIENCKKSGNFIWLEKHRRAIRCVVEERLPNGGGFDTRIELPACQDNKLVFDVSYHHLDAHGSYNGRTYHQVIATADFVYGMLIRVTGQNYNDIKDYIGDTFYDALMAEMSQEYRLRIYEQGEAA